MRALLLLVFLAGCRCEEEPPPQPEPDVPTPPRERWGTVDYRGLQIRLPESWTKDPKQRGDQLFLFGPEKDGFKPSVQLEWKPTRLGPEKWAQINREKYDNPNSEALVHHKGWTTLGGRRAYVMIYELTDRDPGRAGERARFMFIDWYVHKDGHAGMLRGLARQERFAFEYRPFFEQVAATFRYKSR